MTAEGWSPKVFDRLQLMLTSVLTQSPIEEDDARHVLQEMVSAVEELRVADEELTVQAEHLAASAGVIDAERARYAELFDFAPEAYVETDGLGKIVEANRGAEALLGMPLRLLVGKLLVSFVEPEERRRFRSLLGRTEHGRSEHLFTITPRDRGVVSVGVVCAAHRGPEPGQLRMRWLLHDVTERLQLEGRVDELLAEVDVLRGLERLQGFTDAIDPFEGSLAKILTTVAQVVPNGDIGVTVADRPGASAGLDGSDLARALDAAQHAAGSGPSIEAIETGNAVRGPLWRWPEVAVDVDVSGVVEAVGIPMTRAHVRGVISVYVHGEVLDDHTVRLLTLLAEQAAGVLYAAQLLQASSNLVGNLNRALDSRAVIEQAKGLLMARHRCDADGAFTMLRNASQRENVKLREVAQRIVTSSSADPEP